MRISLLTTTLAILTACVDKLPIDSAEVVCTEPTEHGHDPTKPVWSYHGAEDGPEMWGSLDGYAACSAGELQSPIDLVPSEMGTGAGELEFLSYDAVIPLNLWNNGHTLQVNVTGTQSEGDPRVQFGEKVWYLVQFHGHSTSEHTVNELSSAFEMHFVHQAVDGTRAVVGVLMDEGVANATLETLYVLNPGHELELSCDSALTLADVPVESSYYKYDGSLTTPDCEQNVTWFVIADHGSVSADQASEWVAEFGGTTNRPTQPQNDREVLAFP